MKVTTVAMEAKMEWYYLWGPQTVTLSISFPTDFASILLLSLHCTKSGKTDSATCFLNGLNDIREQCVPCVQMSEFSAKPSDDDTEVPVAALDQVGCNSISVSIVFWGPHPIEMGHFVHGDTSFGGWDVNGAMVRQYEPNPAPPPTLRDGYKLYMEYTQWKNMHFLRKLQKGFGSSGLNIFKHWVQTLTNYRIDEQWECVLYHEELYFNFIFIPIYFTDTLHVQL